MNISAYIENDYIIVEVGEGVSLDDLMQYQFNNFDYLKYSNLIYDLTSFEFNNISADDIYAYVKEIKSLNDISTAKKVAIIISSEEGEIVSRLFKHNAKNELDVFIEIFKDKRAAIDWLVDNDLSI